MKSKFSDIETLNLAIKGILDEVSPFYVMPNQKGELQVSALLKKIFNEEDIAEIYKYLTLNCPNYVTSLVLSSGKSIQLKCIKPYGDFKVAVIKPQFTSVREIRDYEVSALEFPELDSTLDMLFLMQSVKITERENLKYLEKIKQKNTKLNKFKEDTLEAMKIKDLFLSSISHELRAPLQFILGYLEEGMELVTDNLALENLQKVKGYSEHMLALVNDLLTLEKIKNESIAINFESNDLHLLFEDLSEIFARKCQSKDIKFNLSLGCEVGKYYKFDLFRLRQVVINLVENAIKFTDRGEINVKLSVLDKLNGNDLIRVEVKDTGIGIKPSDKQRIFNQFEQVHSASNKFGAGLGLAITKNILGLMGGELNVVSNIGVGSIFFFDIPMQLASKTRSEPNVSVSQNDDLSGKRVLLVDDNIDNHLLFKAYTKKVGLKITSAYSGEEAINLYLEEKFDLVVMDIQMPLMDGFECTVQLKNLKCLNSGVPIVALTGNSHIVDKKELVEKLFNDYVLKPIKKDIFIKKITDYLL